MSQEGFDFAGFRALENHARAYRSSDDDECLSQESQESQPSRVSTKPVEREKFAPSSSSSSEEEIEESSEDGEKENDFRKPISGSPRKAARSTEPITSKKKSKTGKNIAQASEEMDAEEAARRGKRFRDERDYVQKLQTLKVNHTSHISPTLQIDSIYSTALSTDMLARTDIRPKERDILRLALDAKLCRAYRKTASFDQVLDSIVAHDNGHTDSREKTKHELDAANTRKVQMLTALHGWMDECLANAKLVERSAVKEHNSTGFVSESTVDAIENLSNVAVDFQGYMKQIKKSQKLKHQ